MRITNQNQTPVPSSDNSADAAPTPRNDASAPPSPLASPPAAPVQAYSLVPSFELLSLTATLQQIPPVRQEVVAETIRRLAAGDLRTSTALEQTARVLLGE